MKLSLKMAFLATTIIIVAMAVCCVLVLSFTKANITDSVTTMNLNYYYNFKQSLISFTAQQNGDMSSIVNRSFIKKAFNSCFGYAEFTLQQKDDIISNNTGIDPVAILENGFIQADSAEKYKLTSVNDRHYFIVSSTIDLLNEKYTLSLARDVTDTMQGLSVLMIKCIVVCGAVAGITALSMIFLIWRSLLPIKKLTAGSDRFASGEYDSRICFKGKNELSELAQSFNHMADAIEQHIKEVEDISEERQMLLSALSHEMKTPVTAISGYAYALTHAKLSKEQERDAIFFIESECRRLERLSGKLMLLLSLNESEILLQEVSANRFIDNLRPILQPIAKEHAVSLTFESDGAMLNIESDLMTCLVTNLVDNARKAGAKNIRVSFLNGELCVIDDGKGIPEEEFEKVTQPFYILDKSRNAEGFGLGLALVCRIAELHGAELVIESKENKGTAMKIQL